MDGGVVVCGRVFTPGVIERITQTIAAHPDWTRSRLAREVCEWLDWRNPKGVRKEMTGRKALLKLCARGLIELPEPTRQVRFSAKGCQKTELAVAQGFEAELEEIERLDLVLVRPGQRQLSAQWNKLVHEHHYLGYRPLCGAQLRYLISSARGYLGALGFRSAALRSRARERWIGWSDRAREAYIGQVVCNARFVIAAGVKVKNLASKVLALAAERLPEDWEEIYGVRPLLIETYVDPTRFAGTCYRAANWAEVGYTRGRGKVRKAIFVCALERDFRQKLCEEPGPARSSEAARWRHRDAGAKQDWAEGEFGRARLGDRRLLTRVCQLARNFDAQPQANIPQACGTVAATRAAYRFFEHRDVTMHKLLASHYEATMERLAAQKPAVVLAVQDSTSLSFAAHPQMRGTGPLNTKKDTATGFWMHDTMAYTVEGRALGLIDVQLWARGEVGRAKERHRRPIEEKESRKWLKSFAAAARLQRQLGAEVVVVSVGDREADIYELFVRALSEPGTPKLLVRADAHERSVDGGEQKVWQYMRGRRETSQRLVNLPRKGNRRARVADLQMRFAHVQLEPPEAKRRLGAVRLWAVYVTEPNAPAGGEPVEWMLWTTVPVRSDEEAWEKVQWYRRRWEIEEFHRTLKSGCRIEDRQLEDRARFENCLAIDLVVAWRIQNAKKLAREQPDLPAAELFEEPEIQVLNALRKPEERHTPLSARTAVRLTAQLGGFLGRTGDGEPGSITLWRGMTRLQAMKEGWQLALAHLQTDAPPDKVTVFGHGDYG
jgi:hypothetical protein